MKRWEVVLRGRREHAVHAVLRTMHHLGGELGAPCTQAGVVGWLTEGWFRA